MQITWFGHATFRLDFGGTSILLDPFLQGNPSWGKGWDEAAKGIDHILLTHGHADHVGDTLEIAKATGATITSTFEVCSWLGAQGAEKTNPGNHGGALKLGDVTVNFVNAYHSSSITDSDGQIVYMGNPVGFILEAPGEKTTYIMGDTGVFGVMGLYNELWSPKVGIVPIGDRFTMGARLAAFACRRYFDFDTVIPCHFATFPPLDQTADKFLAEMGDQAGRVKVLPIGTAETV